MKIPTPPPATHADSRPQATTATAQAAAAAGTARRAGAQAIAETPGDRVTLSTETSVAVAQTRSDDKVARAEKLRRLEAQVRAGTYQPDPAAIAEGMIEAGEWAQAFDDDFVEA